jgi:transcriptional regulator with XRE-family HTH domain
MAKGRLDKKFIPANIEHLYLRSGLDISEFAKRAGMGRSGMKAIIERINCASLISLIKIANEYGVTLDWLCGKNEEVSYEA